MVTFQYGLAAMGIVAAFALFFLLKYKKQAIKAQQSTTIQSKILKSTTNNSKEQEKATQNKKEQKIQQLPKIKKLQDLQTEYQGLYSGSFRLKSANSIYSITALDFKGSKLLITTTKNQMILFNLKNWKKDTKNSTPQKHFVSLDNNGASAVCIGQKYYYAALTFDKTIVYYEYKGQGGIYFKQVAKFSRNIFKTNASTMHVSKAQNYIITTGTGADTVIDVWSMKGQKLANLNTFQIEHYGISCGYKDILVRGWTSQIKIFGAVQQKDGSFKKLQKRQHLAHEQSPLSSAICNRDMFAMSISKHHKVKIWTLYTNDFHRTHESSLQTHPQFTALKVDKCNIYTFEYAVGHFKTIIIIAHSNGFILTDTNLKIINKVQGVELKQININGTQKNVILGVINSQGQILLWNLTKQLDKVPQIAI